MNLFKQGRDSGSGHEGRASADALAHVAQSWAVFFSHVLAKAKVDQGRTAPSEVSNLNII